jgi:hypothetical protein
LFLEDIRPFNEEKGRYFPRPVPASLRSWLDGLGKTPLLVRACVADPVVVPGFVFDVVASGSTLFWLDAPGAGCIWADAIAVAPNSAAATRAEMGGLQRMAIFSSLLPGLVMRK